MVPLVLAISVLAWLVAGPEAGFVVVTAGVAAWGIYRTANLGSVALPILLGVATVYGIFPQLALVYYEDLLGRANPYLPVGSIPKGDMMMFINLALVSVAFIGVRVTGAASRRGLARSEMGVSAPVGRWAGVLSIGIVVFAIAAIVGSLVLDFGTLSYGNIITVGRSSFVAQSLAIAPALAVASWGAGARLESRRATVWKVIALLLAVATIAYGVRSGDRTPLAGLALGFSAMAIWPVLTQSRRGELRSNSARIVVVVIVLAIGATVGTNVRTTRGSVGGDLRLEVLNPSVAFSGSGLHDLVFQDWALPGLLVGLSMSDAYVDPGLVARTSFETLPFVSTLTHGQSTGEVLARRYDPVSQKGYGDYILRDGYTIAGWLGLAIAVAILLFLSRALDWFFRRIALPPAVSAGLTGAVAVLMVRSQASAAVRVFLLDLVVAVILYRFATRPIPGDQLLDESMLSTRTRP